VTPDFDPELTIAAQQIRQRRRKHSTLMIGLGLTARQVLTAMRMFRIRATETVGSMSAAGQLGAKASGDSSQAVGIVGRPVAAPDHMQVGANEDEIPLVDTAGRIPF
jgi:hypothetical protein